MKPRNASSATYLVAFEDISERSCELTSCSVTIRVPHALAQQSQASWRRRLLAVYLSYATKKLQMDDLFRPRSARISNETETMRTVLLITSALTCLAAGGQTAFAQVPLSGRIAYSFLPSNDGGRHWVSVNFRILCESFRAICETAGVACV